MKTPEPLFILDIANNHMGDVEHGLRIISELQTATKHLKARIAVKFQYRHLDTFIHPDFRERMEIKYVKRFKETRLSADDFLLMKTKAETYGMETICTGFDETSIDLIEAQGFNRLKIASCSFTDWPLLERIVKSSLPVLASVGGVSVTDIDRVVSFFEHRKVNFSLMHCVAEYPTPDHLLNLGQIDYLRSRYPNLPIGFSTHERPDLLDAVKIAVAKGALLFERHVGVPTEHYPLNAYSSTPAQVAAWIEAALQALVMCGDSSMRSTATDAELRELHALRRGIFLKQSVNAGDLVSLDKIFFAIPSIDGQCTANDFSKYSQFRAVTNIPANGALTKLNANGTDQREAVDGIVRKVRGFVIASGVPLPKKADVEISHHFGIENFHQTGAVILNFVNRSYCKKAIVMLPGQQHPEHSHKVKEETFFILHGSMTLYLDGKVSLLTEGDSVLVSPGQWHSFSTEKGVIFEEISSTHIAQDSYYKDPTIAGAQSRKTFVTYWLE
jgi:sialic acid synthase SpsE/mannose-6-phosphate isomerase-like protein (cupin superfamily)